VRSLHRSALITALVLLAWIGVSQIRLPVQPVDLIGVVAGTPELTLGMLGIQPFVGASLLVEVVLFLGWRKRRHEAVVRSRACTTVLVLGLVLVGVQAASAGVSLESIAGSEVGVPVLWALLVAGSVSALAAALLLGRFGLGDGFAWILLAQLVSSGLVGATGVGRQLLQGELVPLQGLLMLGAAALVVVGCVLFFQRLSVPGPGLPFRLPTSGLWPWTLGLLVTSWTFGMFASREAQLLATVLIVVLWTPIASLIWHWRSRAELRQQYAAAWRRAQLLTGVLLAVLAGLDTLLLWAWGSRGWPGLIHLVLGTALVLDLRAEWRARSKGAVLLDQAWDLPSARLAQARLGPGVVPVGLHYRTLTRIFGVLVPIRLFGEPRGED
jgi:hypothetical protein